MESFSFSCGGSSSSSTTSLVLDSARGELVEAPANPERKAAAAAERSVEALKNHSEAERRRRARINAHFDTLRTLLPGATKMDKASLLGEVIKQLKDLKRRAREAREQHSVIPKDTDEVKVEQEGYNCNNNGQLLLLSQGMNSMRVSVSCDYRPGLLSDLRRALDAVDSMATTTSAEVSTLGCRMRTVVVMTADHDEALCRSRARALCQAVRSVVENSDSSSDDFSRSSPSSKRPRVSI